MSEMALQLIRQAKAEGWKTLDLGNTGIVGEVPPAIWVLTELEELILSNEWDERSKGYLKSKNTGPENKISSFPAPPPQKIDAVSGGKIVQDRLNGLMRLTKLILAKAQVADIQPLAQLSNLQYLYLGNTQVADIQPLAQLSNLQYLDLSRTQVADIQPLAPLSDLQNLDLHNTQVADIQPLAQLSNLQYLDLDNTQVADIQPLAQLSNLQELHLSNTQVEDIQPLATFSNLQYLDLSETQVADIQPLAQLSNLHVIDLSRTQVADIQPLAQLSNLQSLYLSDTQVADIQPLAQLSNLQYLYLSSTKVEFPPQSILSQGAQAVVRYLQQAQREKDAELHFTNWQLKLVVVGNSRAGKTSLIQSWMTGQVTAADKSTLWLGYQPWSPNYQFELTRENEVFGYATLHVFDFGGQDYFHDAHHLFFSGNAAYLVLWDARKDHVGRAEDVEGIMQLHYPLAYWLDAIRFHTGRPAKDKGTSAQRNGWKEGGEEEPFDKDEDQSDGEKAALVGREADTIRALVVQTHTDETGIQHPDTRQLKADFPWIYDFEAISLAPEAPRRIISLQYKLTEMLAELPSLGQKFLATYAWVRDALPAYTGTPTCTREVFRVWANEQVAQGLEDNKVMKDLRKGLLFTAENIDSVLRYLRDLGVVLYYPEVAVLKDMVFMRPEEIRKAALKVLEGLGKRDGYFDKAYLSKCLGNAAETTQMLALMQQFKMAFRLPDSVTKTNARWVAPLYLPEAAPAGISLLLQVFERPVRRIVYPHFIHKSVILELFQAYIQDVYAADPDAKQPDYLIWREGMVIQVKGSKELVLLRFFLGAAATEKDVEKAAHIDVFSFGEPDVKRRAADVLATLARINKGWTTEEQVTVDGQRFVPLKALRDAAKAKEVVLPHAEKNIALEDYHDYVEFPFARVFVSYAEEDEEFAKELRKQLSPLEKTEKVALFQSRALQVGQHTDSIIRKELARADIVILLMSSAFFDEGDIWDKEFEAAMARLDDPKFKLIAVQIRACMWDSTKVSKVQIMFEDEAVGYAKHDSAWKSVALEVKKHIDVLFPKGKNNSRHHK